MDSNNEMKSPVWDDVLDTLVWLLGTATAMALIVVAVFAALVADLYLDVTGGL